MLSLHTARAVTISMLFSAKKGNTKRKSYERTKWLPLERVKHGGDGEKRLFLFLTH